jgi:hypothetical protein
MTCLPSVSSCLHSPSDQRSVQLGRNAIVSGNTVFNTSRLHYCSPLLVGAPAVARSIFVRLQDMKRYPAPPTPHFATFVSGHSAFSDGEPRQNQSHVHRDDV